MQLEAALCAMEGELDSLQGVSKKTYILLHCLITHGSQNEELRSGVPDCCWIYPSPPPTYLQVLSSNAPLASPHPWPSPHMGFPALVQATSCRNGPLTMLLLYGSGLEMATRGMFHVSLAASLQHRTVSCCHKFMEDQAINALSCS